MVFIRTSPFRLKDAQYSNGVTVPLCTPTSNTHTLLRATLAGLRSIYKPGFRFAKAGVMLVDLVPEGVHQAEFDFNASDTVAHAGDEMQSLMRTVDELNRRFGRGSVKVASAGASASPKPAGWTMRQERRTPAYTTCWADLAVVRA